MSTQLEGYLREGLVTKEGAIATVDVGPVLEDFGKAELRVGVRVYLTRQDTEEMVRRPVIEVLRIKIASALADALKEVVRL